MRQQGGSIGKAIEGKPLEGLCLLNTREAAAAAALTLPLSQLGAEVLESPAIVFAPPDDWKDFDNIADGLTPTDWVVFTSANAVRFVLQRLRENGQGKGKLATTRLAAVGTVTAKALEAEGLPVAVVPELFQQEGLLAALLPTLEPGVPVWLPRALEAREVLADGLREAGHPVIATTIYQTMPAPGLAPRAARALEAGEVDFVLFTSPSTVNHFLDKLNPAQRHHLDSERTQVGCLGRVTAAAAQGRGLPVALVPETQTIEGLVEALVALVKQEKKAGANISRK